MRSRPHCRYCAVLLPNASGKMSQDVNLAQYLLFNSFPFFFCFCYVTWNFSFDDGYPVPDILCFYVFLWILFAYVGFFSIGFFFKLWSLFLHVLPLLIRSTAEINGLIGCAHTNTHHNHTRLVFTNIFKKKKDGLMLIIMPNYSAILFCHIIPHTNNYIAILFHIKPFFY